MTASTKSSTTSDTWTHTEERKQQNLERVNRKAGFAKIRGARTRPSDTTDLCSPSADVRREVLAGFLEIAFSVISFDRIRSRVPRLLHELDQEVVVGEVRSEVENQDVRVA